MKLLRSKKGFTLVELIVVIVIIAILAAALVTSLVGYINKAKNTNAQVEANNTYIAAQSYISEALGTAKVTKGADAQTQINEYLGTTGITVAASGNVQSCIYDAKGTIVYFAYKATNGIMAYYTSTATASADIGWTVNVAAPAGHLTAGSGVAPFELVGKTA